MSENVNNKLIPTNKMIAGRILPAIISFMVLVFLDQFSKTLIVNRLGLGESIPIIENVFELHYIRNTGTAWGLLADKQILFAITTIIVFVVCIYFYIKIVRLNSFRDLRVIIVLLLAGGMGNFIDRLRFKYVIDFLYFKLIDFPVFNVADCYVTVSFFVLILIVFFKYKEEDFNEIFESKR